jgi:hypothetical protein
MIRNLIEFNETTWELINVEVKKTELQLKLEGKEIRALVESISLH